jgi:integrase
MANRKLPLIIRRLDDWPSCDREAWHAACRSGGWFDESGPLARYAATRLRVLEAAYGRWLAFVVRSQALKEPESGCRALDAANLQPFVAFLGGTLSPRSIATYLDDLLIVARALAPECRFADLARVADYQLRIARPVRDKRLRVVPSRDLYELGFRLMKEALAIRLPLHRSCAFRDGLMIAMLAARPIRLGNFASIELDRHLIRTGGGFRLIFPAEEVKNREPLDYPVPVSLAEPIDRYLSEHRSFLLNRRSRADLPASQALWLSTSGAILGRTSIWTRITRLTERHLGHHINPHLFRDCAATSIAIELPSQVGIIRPVLGHTNGITGQRYYNQARTLGAARTFQGTVNALIKAEQR